MRFRIVLMAVLAASVIACGAAATATTKPASTAAPAGGQPSAASAGSQAPAGNGSVGDFLSHQIAISAAIDQAHC
jgi:hypothetical protein